MLQQDKPDDYVIATGETYSVKEFLDLAFKHVNLNWEDYVAFDPRYLRPAEVELLIGDPSKAKAELGWEPTVTFEELTKLMVEADLEAIGIPVKRDANNNGSSIDIATIRRDVAGILS